MLPMRLPSRPLVTAALLGVLVTIAASCALLLGAYRCTDDDNCPTGQACGANGITSGIEQGIDNGDTS